MKKTTLKLELYTKGKNYNWYCDYYYYNYKKSEQGTTKATGYGYEKKSTALSNALNKYRNNYKRYNKKAKKYSSYGLYDDNSISQGIGTDAVIKCLNCFKNVKIIDYIQTERTVILNIEIIESAEV